MRIQRMLSVLIYVFLHSTRAFAEDTLGHEPYVDLDDLMFLEFDTAKGLVSSEKVMFAYQREIYQPYYHDAERFYSPRASNVDEIPGTPTTPSAVQQFCGVQTHILGFNFNRPANTPRFTRNDIDFVRLRFCVGSRPMMTKIGAAKIKVEFHISGTQYPLKFSAKYKKGGGVLRFSGPLCPNLKPAFLGGCD